MTSCNVICPISTNVGVLLKLFRISVIIQVSYGYLGNSQTIVLQTSGEDLGDCCPQLSTSGNSFPDLFTLHREHDLTVPRVAMKL